MNWEVIFELEEKIIGESEKYVGRIIKVKEYDVVLSNGKRAKEK